MKKIFIIGILLLSFAGVVAGREKPKFFWDAHFGYNFDNREFAAGGDHFTRSMTINVANFQPTVGFHMKQGECFHKLSFGIDLQRDMGSKTIGRDLCLFWYDFVRKKNGTSFSATFGVFPRRILEGEYGRAFVSDSVKVVDRTLEGALFRWESDKFMTELGCDWYGMQRYGVRERFFIFSYGQYRPVQRLRLGWTAKIDHFANPSEIDLGVVDDILAEPFVAYDFTPSNTGWDKIELKLSWLESFQRSRREQGNFIINGGANAHTEAIFHGFGIESDTYVGGNLMPLYSGYDLQGTKYGSVLYHGDPFYRVVDSRKGVGVYSRNALFWRKDFKGNLSMRIDWIMHFSDYGKGFLYQGSQQMFTVIFRIG